MHGGKGGWEDEIYLTYDFITDPPTSVAVLMGGLSVCWRFQLEVGFIEETEGWRNRHEKRGRLAICILHSFGRCQDVVRGGQNCNQIHVRADSLAHVRSLYNLPQRRILFKSVKGSLTEELLGWMSEVCGEECRESLASLNYLEFTVDNVARTEGFESYRQNYEAWLRRKAEKLASVTICAAYCSKTGGCCKGEKCHELHPNIEKARLRDTRIAERLKAYREGAVSSGEELVPAALMREIEK